ncbi:hypothetical protein VP01_1587g4 [Puccinia sorghi]|uniref:Uncharacterized protein n=1 Tax=Puccinia sorghi TaxID=27349 RepID=A0A0L6VJE0_9BASI|nr:hypothetical protein VP01_1587g4 [Puccinia sorghi]
MPPESRFVKTGIVIAILIITYAITALFLWSCGSSSSPTSPPFPPNLSMINLTQTPSFFNSCVLLESIKGLEVSSFEFCLISKLHKFSPNIDAKNELNEGPQISALWKDSTLNLHNTTRDAQLLHPNGIWETNLLFNEMITLLVMPLYT